MDVTNLLDIHTREELYRWYQENHHKVSDFWLRVNRAAEDCPGVVRYIDAVEVALCFGWIDSTTKAVDGARLQRFGPRQPRSLWTELNKERVRRLEALGLMTDAGRAVLPAMGPRSFRIDPDLQRALANARAWSKFRSFPALYQRVRAYNVTFYKDRDPATYPRALTNLVAHTKRGEMYGQWNDYGRLLEY